jgi:hypothetical protein
MPHLRLQRAARLFQIVQPGSGFFFADVNFLRRPLQARQLVLPFLGAGFSRLDARHGHTALDAG